MSNVPSITATTVAVSVLLEPPVDNLPTQRAFGDGGWGIDSASGLPYYDSDGATSGELALISLDETNVASLVPAIDPEEGPPVSGGFGGAVDAALLEFVQDTAWNTEFEHARSLMEHREQQLASAVRSGRSEVILKRQAQVEAARFGLETITGGRVIRWLA